MNLTRHTIFLPLLGFFFLSMAVQAQDTDNPGSYMGAVYKARGDMDAKYMQYISAAAHGRRARKVEKLRQEVLDNITQSRDKTADLPYYKGDNSLRRARYVFLQGMERVLSEDYKKI